MFFHPGSASVVSDATSVETQHYASPACDDPAKLVAKMIADVRAALRRDLTLSVGTVQDGAPEM